MLGQHHYSEPTVVGVVCSSSLFLLQPSFVSQAYRFPAFSFFLLLILEFRYLCSPLLAVRALELQQVLERAKPQVVRKQQHLCQLNQRQLQLCLGLQLGTRLPIQLQISSYRPNLFVELRLLFPLLLIQRRQQGLWKLEEYQPPRASQASSERQGWTQCRA